MSEMQSEGQMTNAEAVAALQADEQSTPDPGFAANPPEQAAPATPEGQTPPESATPFETPAESSEDTFMGGDFNPDLLPDELKPGFKQLQAAFTQKTQALAERSKQFEGLGDPDELRQAHELYTSLQNPEYLQAFHGELTTVLKDMGLSPAEAAEAAQQTIEEAKAPSAPELSPELAALAQSDPELAPAANEIAALRAELNQMQEAQTARDAAAEQQRYEMALEGEINRQVSVVREAHPEYGDDDWNAIYERASFYDGNVLKAAELFESDKARIIQAWTQQKTAVPSGVQPTANAGTVSEVPDEGPQTLDEGHEAALAYMAAHGIEESAL